MPRVLLVLAVLSASIFCIIECIRTDKHEVRNLPKVVWVLLILLAPLVGPVAWFVAGRPRRERRGARPTGGAVQRRPAAPDDDPMFLAGLDRTNDERRRLEAWERELTERESDLRGASGPDQEDPARDARDPRAQDGPGDGRIDGPIDGPGDEPVSRS